RAAYTKNKKDREAYNGCCPCGHRDSPVCLRVYIDETMSAAEQRYELATVHSITSSARESSVGGTSRPRALAALRLITSSNFVGCQIDNSEAFAPLRILTTNAAARRLRSGTFGP